MSTIITPPPLSFESERLVIRCPHPDDALVLNLAVKETFEQLNRWMPWAKSIPELDESRRVCLSARMKFLANVDFMLFLFEKSSGDFVGSSGLHTRDRELPSFEIGYWVSKGKQRKGYCVEATRRITEVGFSACKAKRIFIRTDEKNKASQQIAEKAGFNCEGVFKNYEIGVDGTVRNTVFYSQLPAA